MRLGAFLLLVIIGCSNGGAQSQLLTPDAFEAKLASSKDKLVIDVRTPDEYAKGHLSGATMIDFYEADFKTKLTTLDKSKPVFVYCAAGGRSGSATDVLKSLGFKRIYDLKGGIRAWNAAGKPVTR